MNKTATMLPPAAARNWCNFCRTPISTSAAVRLWDGRDYCATCVENACPGLGKYAARHEVLEGAVEFSVWRDAAVMFAMVAVSFIAVFGAGTYAYGLLVGEWTWWEAVQEYYVRALFFALAGFVAATLLSVGARCGWPKEISLRDGVLRTRIHRKQIQARLSDCRWLEGPLMYARPAKKSSQLNWAPAVIIALPKNEWEIQRSIAVGWDDELREYWRAVLTLSQTPRCSLRDLSRLGTIKRLWGEIQRAHVGGGASK